jgi:hypothetical protein
LLIRATLLLRPRERDARLAYHNALAPHATHDAGGMGIEVGITEKLERIRRAAKTVSS